MSTPGPNVVTSTRALPSPALAGGEFLSRREAMRRGLLTTAGLLLADQWALPALAVGPSSKPNPPAKAKAVIQIWMWGGAGHLDTFDPKPEAGQ